MAISTEERYKQEQLNASDGKYAVRCTSSSAPRTHLDDEKKVLDQVEDEWIEGGCVLGFEHSHDSVYDSIQRLNPLMMRVSNTAERS